jgi:hypothetical protein
MSADAPVDPAWFVLWLLRRSGGRFFVEATDTPRGLHPLSDIPQGENVGPTGKSLPRPTAGFK